jgi:hypothetical protein
MALPDYLQDTAKDFAKQLTATTSVPIDTTKFTGRQFVGAEDPLQTQAIGIAQQGVGSYQPFLTAAQQAGVSGATTLGTAATTLGGAQPNITTAQGLAPTTGAAATTLAQDFMSPFQQQVIDTTLAEFDRNRAIQEQRIRDQQAQLGVLGAGRAGVQLAEFQTGSDRDRAALQAQLLSQGFGQGQAAAQQALANQLGLAGAQQQQSSALQGLAGQQFGQAGFQTGLSNFLASSRAADIQALGGLGSLRQGITQAQLTADQQAAQAAAFEPQQRLQQYGAGLGQVAGFGAVSPQLPTEAPSALDKALGTALGVGGLYAKIFAKPQIVVNR